MSSSLKYVTSSLFNDNIILKLSKFFEKINNTNYETILYNFLKNLKNSESILFGPFIMDIFFGNLKKNNNEIIIVTKYLNIFYNFFELLNPTLIKNFATFLKSKSSIIFYFNDITVKIIHVKLLSNKNDKLYHYLLYNSFIDITCIAFNGRYLSYNIDNLNKIINLNLNYINSNTINLCKNIINVIRYNYKINNLENFDLFVKNDTNVRSKIYYNNSIYVFDHNNLNIDNLFSIDDLNIIDYVLFKLKDAY